MVFVDDAGGVVDTLKQFTDDMCRVPLSTMHSGSSSLNSGSAPATTRSGASLVSWDKLLFDVSRCEVLAEVKVRHETIDSFELHVQPHRMIMPWTTHHAAP